MASLTGGIMVPRDRAPGWQQLKVHQTLQMPDPTRQGDLGVNFERGVGAGVKPGGVDACTADPAPASQPFRNLAAAGGW
jgi:hypothetical protein